MCVTAVCGAYQNQMNVFKLIGFTFVPPKFKKLVEASKGKIFLAIMLVFLAWGLLNAVSFCFTLDEIREVFEAECPDFSLTNHIFEIEKPYVNAYDDVYIAIDDSIMTITNENFKSFVQSHDYAQILMVGKYDIAAYSEGRMNVLSYKDFGNFTLTKDICVDFYFPLGRVIVFVGILLWSFISIGIFYYIS